MVTPDAVAERVRADLRQAADPAIAPGQQAYMRSTMPFLGVRVPAVRSLTRSAVRGITDVQLLREAALLLWREAAFREQRYAATAITGVALLRGRLDLLPVHEEMIRTGAWWDHVDEVSGRVGSTLTRHPEPMTATLLAWAHDPDLWVRRCSIIAQLGFRGATDRALLAAAIEANVDDPDFFVRKAIGWALRDLARTDPDWVRSFVASHALSPLSRREALKHVGA